MPNRQNNKGGSKYEQHIRIPHWMMYSEAWAELKPSEKAVLIELMKRYNGFNNGRIGLSQRSAAEHCNISKATARTALISLEKIGFIVKHVTGSFSNKTRKASEFELTHVECNGQRPSKKFMSYKAKKREKSTDKKESQHGINLGPMSNAEVM